MICFSDAHYHNHVEFALPWKDGCNTRLKSQLETLTKIFELTESLGETTIVFLGDLYHTWKSVETPVHAMVSHKINTLLSRHKIDRLYMMPGNHDMPDKSNPLLHTLKAYAMHQKIFVIDSPSRVVIDEHQCVFIPYHEDPEWIVSQARQWKSGASWLFAHLDVVGAKVGMDKYVSKGGVSLDQLGGFACGIFGHFHAPQSIVLGGTTFHYVGSPQHQESVAVGDDPHGVIQLKEGKVIRHHIDAPEFVRVSSNTNTSSLRECDYHLVECTPEEICAVDTTFQGLHVRPVVRHIPKEGKAPIKMAGTDIDAWAAWVEDRGLSSGVDRELLLSYGKYYLEEN